MRLHSCEKFAWRKSLGVRSTGLNSQSCYCNQHVFGVMLERLVSHMKELFHSFHKIFTISLESLRFNTVVGRCGMKLDISDRTFGLVQCLLSQGRLVSGLLEVGKMLTQSITSIEFPIVALSCLLVQSHTCCSRS